MSWVRPIKLGAVTLTGSAALIAGVAHADIVVASSGPSAASYPAGKKLPDNSQITLKTGDSVTILDGQGTRVLRGSGTFTVGRAGLQRRNPTFAALTRERSSARVRTGAVRDPNSLGAKRSPNLWYVDIAQSGPMCILDADAVRLWRADTTRTERFVASAADGTSKAVVTFGEGSMLAVWDVDQAPVVDGAAYKLKKDGASDASNLSFVVLPEAPATPEDTASALIEHGCAAQLELLSATLAVAGE